MSMSDLEKAFILIDNNIQECDFAGANDTGTIKKAEKLLNINFPKTYQLFLEKYGCGNIGSFEVNGIIKDNLGQPGEINTIWLTLKKRDTVGIPPHYIIISDEGYGFYGVLDASQPDEHGEYPVLLWMPVSPETPTEKIANDFGEFLLEQVQQALKPEEDDAKA